MGCCRRSGATSGNNSTDLVISGTLSQVNADLGTLKDTDNSAGPDTITLTASDSFGNAATPATVAVTASVTPVITVPGAQTLGINQLTAISGISLAESGNDGQRDVYGNAGRQQWSVVGDRWCAIQWRSHADLYRTVAGHLEQRPWHAEGHRWHGGSGHYYRQCQRQLWQQRYGADDCGDGERGAGDCGARSADHWTKPVGSDLRRQPNGERQHGWRDVYSDGDGQHWGADGDRWRAIQWRSHADLYRTVADHLE